ncbi:hypothetical protein QTO34_018353 [Cnephaeus nilssonii]|uniref:Glomulin n=1 Tax=Cnephaeus nilssonii TaxID=3371016 RepID=A0AA40LN00_CNENI|nr:hypothetical protein QTO34_018353 [Eptesicus nilssonii]
MGYGNGTGFPLSSRTQILEEQDFKEEDFGLFQLAGQRCIDEGHIDQLLEVIQNEKNKLCNPKELLLGLLELIEEPSGKQISQIILLLLQPLQTVIQKLHSNKSYSVGLALSTIWSQLSLLPVPYSKEQIQADDYGLCQCCKALIEFTKPFVKEVTDDKENSLENQRLKDELLKFCFKSLKCPLLTAQFLEQSEEAENDPLRSFASEIIGFLSAIGYPFPKMIFNHGKKKRTWDYLEFEEEEDKQFADSLASLAYLVFVQGISIDQLPMVLSPSYLLQFNMGHIEVFLQRTEESVFSKGLDLLENSLLRMEDNSLLHQYLEIKSFLTVPQGLVKVMTLCPDETLRKKGLAMLQLYINKLDSQGKYTLFRCLLNTSNHSGVEAFIIQNIKNQIDTSLKRTHNNKWFTGPQLISLLDLVLFLPEGAETDLLQNSDRIMASLNLLRYLVIKDNENDNQVSEFFEKETLQRLEEVPAVILKPEVHSQALTTPHPASLPFPIGSNIPKYHFHASYHKNYHT